MTNIELWRSYTKNLPSPESYITFGWYWLITAALQRRVWYYNGDRALYPNLFLLFVGPPSIGKGLVLGPLSDILRHHKRPDGNVQMLATSTGEERPPLFPVGADTTTFEDLTREVSRSARRAVTHEKKVYAHTSYAFILEELRTLLKRKADDVITFLVRAYDAKDSGYEYKTKHQGNDIIRKICMSFLAGTQVPFLKDMRKQGLFDQGLSSRCVMIFEENKRQWNFHLESPEDSAAQDAALQEILKWVKGLSTLCGPLHYDNTAHAWLEHWYNVEHRPKEEAASGPMKEYYGRKKVHILKLAAGMHFSESFSYAIPLERFQEAKVLLDSIEENMIKGLEFGSRNETFALSSAILRSVGHNGGISKRELIIEFIQDWELDEIYQSINTLLTTKNIVEHANSKNETIYKVP